MSRSQLESRIASLRGRVRRLLLAHGLSWVLAGLLPLVVAACLADWAFHLDPMVRLSLLAAIAAATGWLGWTRVVRPLIVRFEDLDIALRVVQQVTVMHNGRILKHGTPEQIEGDAEVQAIYMGRQH